MKIVFSLFLSKLTMNNILLGTQYYMPPEFMKTGKYDGCEATVWAMGILLVDMLSPVIPAFEKPQHCLSVEPRIPRHFSSGV